MTGTTITTGLGMGLDLPCERLKLRNASASTTALKGECWTFDLTAGGTDTLPLHRTLRDIHFGTAQALSEPGDRLDPYASARELVASVPRQAYPHVIAAENVAAGSRGWFWLKHPDIQVKTGRNNAGSQVISRGLPLVVDYFNGTTAARRRLIWASATGDVPLFSRYVGWSNQDADNQTQLLTWGFGGSGTFLVGDTVTGGTSAATGTITRVVNGAAGNMDVTLLTTTLFVNNDALANGGDVTINNVIRGDIDDDRTIFARFDGEGQGLISM